MPGAFTAMHRPQDLRAHGEQIREDVGMLGSAGDNCSLTVNNPIYRDHTKGLTTTFIGHLSQTQEQELPLW